MGHWAAYRKSNLGATEISTRGAIPTESDAAPPPTPATTPPLPPTGREAIDSSEARRIGVGKLRGDMGADGPQLPFSQLSALTRGNLRLSVWACLFQGASWEIEQSKRHGSFSSAIPHSVQGTPLIWAAT